MTTIDVSLPSTRPSPPPDFRDCLAEIEERRRRQLDRLPDDRLDPVAMAHRAAVMRILEELSIARQRLESGLYGICAACNEAIDPERLDLRPWATRCTGC